MASALLRLADAPDAPHSTLAAGGRRSPRARFACSMTGGGYLPVRVCWRAVLALALAPLVLFAVPAIALSYAGRCPIPLG